MLLMFLCGNGKKSLAENEMCPKIFTECGISLDVLE